MREIKFRVWDKDMKYMHVCGENVHDSMMFVDNVACYYNLQNGCGSFPNGEGTYELMQYTGLKDRNGKDIYEGDVVDYYRHKYRRKLGVVKFGEYEQDGSGGEYVPTKCLGFYVETIKVFPSPLELEFNEEPYEAEEEKTVSILEFDYEVIGNIFENPELISNV